MGGSLRGSGCLLDLILISGSIVLILISSLIRGLGGGLSLLLLLILLSGLLRLARFRGLRFLGFLSGGLLLGGLVGVLGVGDFILCLGLKFKLFISAYSFHSN